MTTNGKPKQPEHSQQAGQPEAGEDEGYVLTPFGALMQDYMWSQRPPLSAAKFARLVGVNGQTLWNWTHTAAQPSVHSLLLIHQKVGIPIRTLFEAAGYPAPPDGGGEDRHSVRERIERAIAYWETNTSASPEKREGALEALRTLLNDLVAADLLLEAELQLQASAQAAG